MKRKILSVVLLLSLLLTLMMATSCGSDGTTADSSNIKTATYSLLSANSSLASTSSAAPAGQKLVKTASMTAYTDAYDSFMQNLSAKMEELGAYIQEDSSGFNSYYSANPYRHADLTIRVPAASLDALVTHVTENATVTNRNVTVEDKTLTYATLQARAESLASEVAALDDLMANAVSGGATVKDLADLQSQIFDVKQELNEAQAQLDTIDSLVAYSTVELRVTENVDEVNRSSENVFVRIWADLKTNCVDIWFFFGDVLVFFIGGLPYFVLIGAIAFGVFVLIRKIIGKKKKKNTPPSDGHKPEML